jgi:NADH-quinone oxidoreductase subunit F
MLAGHELKFWTPGGSSTPMLTAEHLDAPLDFEGMASVGTMLGTTAVQVFSQRDDVVYATYRWIAFYHHESCGKCTPCREGNFWMVRVLHRILAGGGRPADLDLLLDTCDTMLGRSFCALGDGATSPVTSSIRYFKQDYLDYITGRRPALFPHAELVGAHS